MPDNKRKTSRALELDKILYQTEACYQADINEMAIEMFHLALAEFSLEEIKAAFTIHIKTSKFFPKISEIIDIIKNNQPDKPPGIESRAQQQWRIVLSTLGRGPFTDPITAHLCRHEFRHSYLRNILEINEHWEQKRWCEAYALAAEIGVNRLQLEAPRKVLKLTEGIGNDNENS